jgi:hypothetical protein
MYFSFNKGIYIKDPKYKVVVKKINDSYQN